MNQNNVSSPKQIADRVDRRVMCLEDWPQSAAVTSHRQVVADRFDALAGLFTAILMQLQAASDLPIEMKEVRGECLLRAETLARTGLRQVRELVEMSILAADVDGSTLSAMQSLLDSTARTTTAECIFDVRGDEVLLKISVGMTLQRILHEALANAQRYANAKQIKVQLCFEDDRVILEVKDDGSGFVPDEALSSGVGLMEMRARVDRLGGALWLRSAPGEGTHVRVDVPNPYVE